MKTELKKKWLVALRGGEYVQGYEHYVTTGKGYDLFCCLGVLCDIQGAMWDMNSHNNGYNNGYDLDNNTYKNDHYVVNGPDHLKQITLAAMNDSGSSFTEIADYIEVNL